ncbi:MAG TPA: glutathione S-transferase family protein [Polyangiaceae bacterium]|nr:glutathione S-transferase family protein [Polyangiaceae bacterium]
MKYYHSIGPSPATARFFIAEKGLDIEVITLDLIKGENREAPHLARNPLGQLPVLELDDGTRITESIAICETLEELFPSPPLIGTTLEERAETRMWTQRVNLGIAYPLLKAFQFGAGRTVYGPRTYTNPETVPGLTGLAFYHLEWLEKNISDQFLCGSRFTLADILLFSFLTFADSHGNPIDKKLGRIWSWVERVEARPTMKRL